MLTLYISPTALDCRKARLWLQNRCIPFQERNIFTTFLTMAEFHELIQLLPKDHQPKLALFSHSPYPLSPLQEEECYAVLSRCPALLNRPILTDKTHVQIGFSEISYQEFWQRKNQIV